MLTASQLSPGMVVKLGRDVMRVESALKISIGDIPPYMKVKFMTMTGEEIIEKKLKLEQELEEVVLKEHTLEFLYFKDGKCLFLDIDSLEQVFVEQEILAQRKEYLKQGVHVKAHAWGHSIFSVELPPFLELAVAEVHNEPARDPSVGAERYAVLETGARLVVPIFVERGDVIKVDTRSNEYVQRV